MEIQDLGLSARIYNPLWWAGFRTVASLREATDRELLDVRNIGPLALTEIREALAARGDAPSLTHEPRRGSDVEVWIKRRRDSLPGGEDPRKTSVGWLVFDDLLDDYRAHADTGTPLDRDVTRRDALDEDP